ncbi:hypothetical protein [Streptomyces sp. NBC_01563]|uniref:hypothetical protein n=1 Tax=Streptomyces sp. NBC_01563 TaxID=2975880 RepID=UPI00386F5A8F
MTQVRLALALSFADPTRAGDELALAHQLLNGLDQRSNTLLAQVVALIKDAGTDSVPGRARGLRTDIEAAGLPFLHRFVELTLAFHHAVRGENQDLAATISRLRELTATGDFAYFTDIAHFMAALPLPEPSTTRWTRNEDDVRTAWRARSRPARNTCTEIDPYMRIGPDQTLSGRGRWGPRAGDGLASAGGGVLADEAREQFDQGGVHTALFGQEPVDLLLQPIEALAQAVDLLVEIADLEAERGQVALDDAELAVGLLRSLFIAASQGRQLAVGDGLLGHAGTPARSQNR